MHTQLENTHMLEQILSSYDQADLWPATLLRLAEYCIQTHSALALAMMKQLCQGHALPQNMQDQQPWISLLLALPMEHPLSTFTISPGMQLSEILRRLAPLMPELLFTANLDAQVTEDAVDIAQCTTAERESHAPQLYLRLALKYQLAGQSQRALRYLRALMELGFPTAKLRAIEEFQRNEELWSPHLHAMPYFIELIQLLSRRLNSRMQGEDLAVACSSYLQQYQELLDDTAAQRTLAPSRSAFAMHLLLLLDFLSQHITFIPDLASTVQNNQTRSDPYLIYNSYSSIHLAHIILASYFMQYSAKTLAMFAGLDRYIRLKQPNIGKPSQLSDDERDFLIKQIHAVFVGYFVTNLEIYRPDQAGAAPMTLPRYFAEPSLLDLREQARRWLAVKLTDDPVVALVTFVIALLHHDLPLMNRVDSQLMRQLPVYFLEQHTPSLRLSNIVSLFLNSLLLITSTHQQYLAENKSKIIACFERIITTVHELWTASMAAFFSADLAKIMMLCNQLYWPKINRKLKKNLRSGSKPSALAQIPASVIQNILARALPQVREEMSRENELTNAATEAQIDARMGAILASNQTTDQAAIEDLIRARRNERYPVWTTLIYDFLSNHTALLGELKMEHLRELLEATQASRHTAVMERVIRFYRLGIGPVIPQRQESFEVFGIYKAYAESHQSPERCYLSDWWLMTSCYNAHWYSEGIYSLLETMEGLMNPKTPQSDSLLMSAAMGPTMGNCYFHMSLLETYAPQYQDLSKALAHLETATKTGIREALWLNAFMFWTGDNGCPVDFDKALKVLRAFDRQISKDGMADWFQKSIHLILLSDFEYQHLMAAIGRMRLQSSTEMSERHQMANHDLAANGPRSSAQVIVAAATHVQTPGSQDGSDESKLPSAAALPSSLFRTNSTIIEKKSEAQKLHEQHQKRKATQTSSSTSTSTSSSTFKVEPVHVLDAGDLDDSDYDDKWSFTPGKSIEEQITAFASHMNLYVKRHCGSGSRLKLQLITPEDGDTIATFCAHELHGASLERKNHGLAKRMAALTTSVEQSVSEKRQSNSCRPA